MDDMKKQKPVSLQAKEDVIKALRKLAMELMSQHSEDGNDPEAVVAKVDVSSVPSGHIESLLSGLDKKDSMNDMEDEELCDDEESMDEENKESMDEDMPQDQDKQLIKQKLKDYMMKKSRY